MHETRFKQHSNPVWTICPSRGRNFKSLSFVNSLQYSMAWKCRVLLSLAALTLLSLVGILLVLSSTIKETILMSPDMTSMISTDKLTKPAEFTKAAERQEMRKQQLRNYCLEHADETEPGPWDKNQRLEQFLIDDDNKFIYCAVPKAASTPLRLTLIRLKNNSGITITESTVHLPKMWRHLGEYTNSTELPKHLVRHFKFLFVRDPFHRLLSGYRDKFFGKNKRYTNGLRRMIVTAFRPEEVKEVGTETNNVTFTEFLTFILSVSNPLTRDGHWRQIQRLCFPCAFDFDFIGYFETLEEDAAYLLKKAGLDDRVTFPPVRSSKASSDFMTYYSQVPREVIFKLGEAFRSDFEMFGYPFPGPLKSLLGNYANTKS